MPTASTFLMDLAKKEWKRVSDMNVARMDHCACTLFGMIYAIGGIGEHKKYVGSVKNIKIVQRLLLCIYAII